MSTTLYVANLDPDVSTDDLHELFAEHGEIKELYLELDERSQQPVALVTLESEKRATRAMNSLNGQVFQGRRLAITHAEADLSRDLTAKQRKLVDEIIAELEETEKVPLRQIETIVRLCSPQFAQAILEETREIDADEGIMTSDSTRRRTKGGVFFYLARYRMSPSLRRIVYNRKGKIPGETYE